MSPVSSITVRGRPAQLAMCLIGNCVNVDNSHGSPMNDLKGDSFPEIREAVRRLCTRFPGEYWRALDRERAYPTEFVRAMTQEGFLSVLIPEEYGGSGL